jgi:hypothetical protein
MRNAVTPLGLAVAVVVGFSCSSSDNGGGGGGPAGQVIELAPAPNGNNQTATVDALLPIPLRVLVTELGVPVEGVTVEWATSGPGSTIGTSSLTDPNGIAQTVWKISQVAGPQAATATVDGATGSPINFSATGNPGNPTSIEKTSGDSQAQQVGMSFPLPLSLQVTDNFGNGIPSIQMDWSVTSGSIVLDGPSSTTGTDGSTAISITAGNTIGAAQVTAAPAGALNSVTFDLEVTGPQLHITLGNDFFRSLHNGTENPAIDTVAVGTTVIWDKASPAPHTVTSTSGPVAFDSGLLTGVANTNYKFTFTTPGTYTYESTPDGPPMTGELVVQ